MNDEEYEKIEEIKSKYNKEKNWNMAIGLQKIDELSPSDCVLQLADQNIKGEVPVSEIEYMIKDYYEFKEKDENVAEQLESDIVTARMVKLLSDDSFSLNPNLLKSIHKVLFKDIEFRSGKYREYNIRKDEDILCGKSVLYAASYSIDDTLEYDFEQEKQISYGRMSIDDFIERIAKFTSGIWQIHPFANGNTRTVAVLVQKYLKSKGYEINNDIFKDNSSFYRNALVLSNYIDEPNNIYPNYKYLIMFYQNVLRVAKNELVFDEKDLDIFKEVYQGKTK